MGRPSCCASRRPSTDRSRSPHGPPDDRFLYLSDVLPTAWQAVQYANIPPGGSVVVLGLGPIGSMSCRVARHLGASTVVGVDLVPERLDRARLHGADVLNLLDFRDDQKAIADAIRQLTGGRGPDAVIDAVGMEAHGSAGAKMAQTMTGFLPSKVAAKLMEHVGVDRLAALQLGIEVVRRGGTVSLAGVYGGMSDPLPMLVLFDKQIQLRMGQANVKRWVDDILPLLGDEDVLDVEGFATHHLPLSEASAAYEMFQQEEGRRGEGRLPPGDIVPTLQVAAPVVSNDRWSPPCRLTAVLVADAVVDRLRSWHTHHIFGYLGDGIDPILGAIRRAGGDPELVTARHEESAALMPTGYAKWTGGAARRSARERSGRRP